MEPGAGSTVRAGSRVTLIVASEPAPVAVPAVIGQSRAAGTRALQRAGFSVNVQTEVVTEQSLDGRVISTDPAGGTSTDRGATVTMVVGRFQAPAEDSPEETTP